MHWPTDPNKKEPSVSLALVMISTFAIIVGISLHYAGIEVSTELAFEFWSGSAMLYFGRKIPWDKFMQKSTKKGKKDEEE
jgi:hypothetical protein